VDFDGLLLLLVVTLDLGIPNKIKAQNIRVFFRFLSIYEYPV
jgi:hypothetical protein